jgi:hypothetical protein
MQIAAVFFVRDVLWAAMRSRRDQERFRSQGRAIMLVS